MALSIPSCSQRGTALSTASRPAHGAGAGHLCGAAWLLSPPRLAGPDGALLHAGEGRNTSMVEVGWLH